jgi:prepilin-type processing-associated H-X9-DG protein
LGRPRELIKIFLALRKRFVRRIVVKISEVAVMSRPRHLSAFSLVELLVVIGIVVLLAALLLSRARESGRQINCASNLRQLAMAFTAYAQSNNGRPPGVAWGGIDTPYDWVFWDEPPVGTRDVNNSALAPYLGARGPTLRALLRCPSDLLERHHGGYPFSYSMNCGMYLEGRENVAMVKRAAEKVLFYDELNPNDGAFWYGSVGLDILAERHTHLGNVAFFDAHVEARPSSFANDQRYNDPAYPPGGIRIR